MSSLNILGLILSICQVETGMRNVHHLEKDGHLSIGICQVREATAKQFDKTASFEKLSKPSYNILIAEKYFLYQYNRYNKDVRKAISAYNMGSVKYDKTGKLINRSYVNKVLHIYEHNFYH